MYALGLILAIFGLGLWCIVHHFDNNRRWTLGWEWLTLGLGLIGGALLASAYAVGTLSDDLKEFLHKDPQGVIMSAYEAMCVIGLALLTAALLIVLIGPARRLAPAEAPEKHNNAGDESLTIVIPALKSYDPPTQFTPSSGVIFPRDFDHSN